MIVIIFVFALISEYAAIDIPSYIHICNRKDPKLNQCIVNSIYAARDKICVGIPELDVPSSVPFIIEKLVFLDTPNMKINLKNVQLNGFCNYTITDLNMNSDTLDTTFNVIFNQIRINTIFDFEINILVPIMYKGQMYINADNIKSEGDMKFIFITKRSKKYLYLKELKINLDVKNFSVEYDVTDEKFVPLHKIIRDLVGQNHEEIIKSFKPIIEEAADKQIRSIVNGIVKHFTLDEIFPE